MPQDVFDDLYSAVYAILDDAKMDRDLLKLYKGSHGATDPHSHVLEFGRFFYQQRRGLLGWVVDKVGRCSPDVLDEFDALHRPRVSIRAVFDMLASVSRRDGESDQDFLHYLAHRRHSLGAYRGGSSGYDDEARAFAAACFQHSGLQVTPDEVLVCCGGAKGVFLAFAAALMCTRVFDDLHHGGGQLLAPDGYYQSLRLIPAIFGGDIAVAPQLTGPVVREWLADSQGQQGRAIYVPLVNNLDGRVLDRDRALGIAQVVLTHNQDHPGDPVYVLADDVYAGSYLGDVDPQPIGAVTGVDLGDHSLGRMSDWTVSVVTPSKTVALPTSRVAFATSTSARLRQAVAHYRTVFSHGRVPQIDELTAVAALCLTPQSWVDGWNLRYRRTVLGLERDVAALNAEIGWEAYRLEVPQGGWYMPLQMSHRLLPSQVTSSVDAFSVLLHYGGDRVDTGIGMLPGELFGYRSSNAFTLRGSFAVGDEVLAELVPRLRDMATILTGPDATAVVDQALTRARKVAPVDAILRHCRY